MGTAATAVARLRACTDWAWRLDIRGVPVRYYSGSVPPTRPITGMPTMSYVDRKAIIDVGRQSESISLLGGIQQGGALNVTLSSRGDQGDAYDTVRVLCRTGYELGARASTRLAQSIPHDTALIGSIEVTEELDDWPVTDGRYLFWIGQEAFIAESVDTAPPRFLDCHRAAMGSPPQEHLYDPLRGEQAWVTSDPVSWRNVRCALKVAANLGRPLLESDYVEVLRGFLNSAPPSIGNAGLELNVSLVPNSVILDQVVSARALTTGLLQGWHYFEPSRGSVVAHAQVGLRSDLVVATVTQDAVTTDTDVKMPNSQVAELADPTRDPGHPRRLPLHFQASAGGHDQVREPSGVAAGPPEKVTFADGLDEPIPTGTPVTNVHVWDVKAYDLAVLLPTTKSWPEGVLTAVNAAWRPGLVTGADGAWADVEIGVGGDGQPEVRSKVNGEHIAAMVRLEFRADWSAAPVAGDVDHAGERQGDYMPGQGYLRDRHQLLHYGLQFCAPDDDRWFDSRDQERVGSLPLPLDRRSGRWARFLTSTTSRGRPSPRSAGKIRGWASAYYQTGERYILTAGSIFGTSVTGTKWITVDWSEAGTALSQTIPIELEEIHEDDDSNAIGYRLKIREGWEHLVRSFGDWPGEQPATIKAAAAWEAAAAATLVLQLLYSGRGAGVNGAYDVLPFGGNLDSDDVAGSEILARLRPPFDDRWSLIAVAGKKLRDLLEVPLLVCGDALVMRPDPNGILQVTALPVGLETLAEVDASLVIRSGRIEPTARIDTLPDDELTTAYKITSNYDRTSPDPTPAVEITAEDAAARAAQGGDGGEALEVPLRGVYFDSGLDATGRLLPLVGNLKARLGRPRRRYRLTLDKGWGLVLYLGSVVRVTAPDLLFFDGTRGATDLVCRVVKRDVDWWGAEATFELLVYGAKAGGYAPAMKVASVTSSTVIEIEPNQHSDPTDPDTGIAQVDGDWFIAGDIVRCVPRGNFAGSVIRTIASVSGTTVTFSAGPGGGSAAHGLAAGDTIRPAPYTVTTNSLIERFAYLTDARGKLGGTTRGTQWS